MEPSLQMVQTISQIYSRRFPFIRTRPLLKNIDSAEGCAMKGLYDERREVDFVLCSCGTRPMLVVFRALTVL